MIVYKRKLFLSFSLLFSSLILLTSCGGGNGESNEANPRHDSLNPDPDGPGGGSQNPKSEDIPGIPKPTVEPTKPTVDPIKPTVDPTKPTVDPTKPTVDQTKPTVDQTIPEVHPVIDNDVPNVPASSVGKDTTSSNTGVDVIAKKTSQELQSQIFNALYEKASPLIVNFDDENLYNFTPEDRNQKLFLGRRSQVINFHQEGDLKYNDIEARTRIEHYIPLLSNTLVTNEKDESSQIEFKNQDLEDFLEKAHKIGARAILSDTEKESHVILLADFNGAQELKNELARINKNNTLTPYRARLSLITKDDIEFKDESVFLGQTQLMKKTDFVQDGESIKILSGASDHELDDTDLTLGNDFFVFSSVRYNSNAENKSILSLNFLSLSKNSENKVEAQTTCTNGDSTKCLIESNQVAFKTLNTLKPTYVPKDSNGRLRPSKHVLYSSLPNYASFTIIKYSKSED